MREQEVGVERGPVGGQGVRHGAGHLDLGQSEYWLPFEYSVTHLCAGVHLTPLTGLDEARHEEVLQLIREMIDREKVSAWDVTHSRKEAGAIADRVVVME